MRRWIWHWLIMVLACAGAVAPAQAASGWQALPFTLRDAERDQTCWDAREPDVVWAIESGVGVVRYDVRNGVREPWLPRIDLRLVGCPDSGWRLLADQPNMSALAPGSTTLTAVTPFPWTFASDGRDTVYALLGNVVYAGAPGQLASVGTIPGPGAAVALQANPADSRALYAVTLERLSDSAATGRLWFSADGGAVWELRTSQALGGSYGGPYVSLEPLGDAAWPRDTVMWRVDPGYPGSSNRTGMWLSGDGGRTSTGIDTAGYGDPGTERFVAGHDGIVRLGISLAPIAGTALSLSVSTTAGRDWRPLAVPPVSTPVDPRHVELVVARAAPHVMALGAPEGTFISRDAGASWQRVGDRRTGLQFSPYVPLRLLGREGTRLDVLQVGDPGALMTAPRPPLSAAFSPDTGQTISPLFLDVWQARGGLARFGHPRTPAFREVNAADGRVYLTQYFERARFEYHPEHADPEYRVLLGLLGNEQTTGRRAEGPFQPRPAPGDPGERYFAETGHAIRNSFKAAWERAGGLATFGYPISDEFLEPNPEDGQSYVVQYFERNRFEYHPELAGGPYEVLLGLLGNDALRARGWLP